MTEWIKVPYPFYRQEVSADWDWVDGNSPPTIKSWIPGTTYVQHNEYACDAYADGMGFMLLNEIDSKKLPKPYQERVFYIRRWEAPNGQIFGKTNLRITTRASFTKLQNGYRHRFILDAEEIAA